VPYRLDQGFGPTRLDRHQAQQVWQGLYPASTASSCELNSSKFPGQMYPAHWQSGL
jgi:hypothetical protein